MVRELTIILAHRYGVDRSWFFNLGIKINEATGATILWPDLRGHGLNPSVSWTSFGSIEGDDIQAALDYLRTLKSVDGQTLVGDKVALYGVEMGGYAALRAAAHDAGIEILVLDSLPRDPEEVLQAAVRDDLEIDNSPIRFLTRTATRLTSLVALTILQRVNLRETERSKSPAVVRGRRGLSTRFNNRSRSMLPNKANLEMRTDLPLLPGFLRNG